jgi:hypothetical protein
MHECFVKGCNRRLKRGSALTLAINLGKRLRRDGGHNTSIALRRAELLTIRLGIRSKRPAVRTERTLKPRPCCQRLRMFLLLCSREHCGLGGETCAFPLAFARGTALVGAIAD